MQVHLGNLLLQGAYRGLKYGGLIVYFSGNPSVIVVIHRILEVAAIIPIYEIHHRIIGEDVGASSL